MVIFSYVYVAFLIDAPCFDILLVLRLQNISSKVLQLPSSGLAIIAGGAGMRLLWE